MKTRRWGDAETRRLEEMLTVLTGDALEQLRTLPDASVQCCVTSPAYWGLRDYGVEGQMGLGPRGGAETRRMNISMLFTR